MMRGHSEPGARARAIRSGLCGVALLVAVALAFFAWQNFFPVQASDGWRYSVAYERLPKVASLIPQEDGALILSQELDHGQGSILRIAPDGSQAIMVANLSKPDGMIPARGGWVYSQEVEGAVVRYFKDGVSTDLFKGQKVQGLWDDGEYLYAIEDRKGDGRLLRYRWNDGALETVRDHLDEAESVTRCGDGRMLYTEKERGVVRQLSDDGADPVVLAGLNQPTYLMCDERGLWISEDTTHRARLLLLDSHARLQTILSFLKAPQMLTRTPQGTYLLAEGGRDRILEITPPVSDGGHP
nr:hypothetical protein [Pseudomonas sp. PA1(2017)]